MLHTKFLLEFGTDGPISKVFTICVVAILVTWTIYTNFGSPFLRTIHMKFGFDWHSDFSGISGRRRPSIVDNNYNDGAWILKAHRQMSKIIFQLSNIDFYEEAKLLCVSSD